MAKKDIDLFVCGSSHASGVGKGKESTYNEMHEVKSWVRFLAEKYQYVNNLWNISLPGRPLGLTTSDTVEFVRDYYKKYGNYDKLFVILEYTYPTYRHWDPVALARNDTKNLTAIPVSYYRLMRNNEHLTNHISMSSLKDEFKFIEQKFYQRTDVNFIDHKMDRHDNIYQEISIKDLDEEQYLLHNQKVKSWFEYDFVDVEIGSRRWSDNKSKQFIRYATDEVFAMKNWLEHFSIPYLMFWVGGENEVKNKHIDAAFRKLIQTKRMIPVTDFNMVTASKEWSIKHWRSHPDETGHERISEFILDWIERYNLLDRPKQEIYTG